MNKLKKLLLSLTMLATVMTSFSAQAIYLMLGALDGSNANNPASFSLLLMPFQSTNMVFRTNTSLASTGVNLPPINFDSQGGLYCKNGPSGTIGETLRFTHNLVAGPTYSGHQLYKTSHQGLYFDVNIVSVRGAYTTFAPNSFYLPSGKQDIVGDTQWAYCGNGFNRLIGGMIFQIQVNFYTDNTFSFNEHSITAPVTFATSGVLPNAPFSDAGIRLENASGDGSYWTINISSKLYISPPTCYGSVVTGTSGAPNTIDMGRYTTGQLINDNVANVPFAILLTGCMQTKFIAVKLSSSNVGISDKSLLANKLTTEGQALASGVGVQITGQSNIISGNTLMVPGGAAYQDLMQADSPSYSEATLSAIIQNGAVHKLDFKARMKQDGEQPIVAGEFMATGTFTITYP
ncbi:fimbrial protein [Kluyvera sp. STS39-E]|uniref:fimbrial protein n=1 Tax=Kluyvera sp. STS39-E TaxID=3234748 RepID=UPI0034C60F37